KYKENKMKYGLLALATLIPFTALASDSTLNESLKPWQPLSIERTESNITIVMDEMKVTDVMLSAVAENGVCMPLWLNKEASYLEGIKEVSILNKFKRQGYVLEEPLSTCKAIGEATGNTGKIILLGHTRMF
ncbi:MAG: hypothetical protein ACTJH9_15710, partial [Pseudoalteromonas sp.]|uniref:hypothetical protein n=1 Tax=Pseudoalteromonas sp. TaxID=53249 RepID=UPI003F987A82